MVSERSSSLEKYDRFVNNFPRKRRGKSTLHDPLEEIEELGAKKLPALLRHVGGRKGIEAARIKALQQVPGIGYALASRIHNHLHDRYWVHSP